MFSLFRSAPSCCSLIDWLDYWHLFDCVNQLYRIGVIYLTNGQSHLIILLDFSTNQHVAGMCALARSFSGFLPVRPVTQLCGLSATGWPPRQYEDSRWTRRLIRWSGRALACSRMPYWRLRETCPGLRHRTTPGVSGSFRVWHLARPGHPSGA